MRIPRGLIVATVLLMAVVIQTTLFGQLRPFVPDLTLLVVIMLALTRVRSELILAVAFASGLMVDLLGSSLMGLRAVVFTVIAYIAIRTRAQAEIGRYAAAIWAGVLTFLALALLVVVGTLFGQTNLVSADIGQRLVLVPLFNMVLAGIFSPMFIRLVDRDSGLFGYS